MLSSFVNKNGNDWDDHLPYILVAYRPSEHISTGVTPHKMMCRREMTYPLDIIAGNPKSRDELLPIDYVQWLNHTFEVTFNFTRDSLSKAAVRQKNTYDRCITPRSFKVGDFAWRWYPPTAGITLGLGWTGPYTIIYKYAPTESPCLYYKHIKYTYIYVHHYNVYIYILIYTCIHDLEMFVDRCNYIAGIEN